MRIAGFVAMGQPSTVSTSKRPLVERPLAGGGRVFTDRDYAERVASLADGLTMGFVVDPAEVEGHVVSITFGEDDDVWLMCSCDQWRQCIGSGPSPWQALEAEDAHRRETATAAAKR